MSQTYDDNTKRPKPKENQQSHLGNLHILLEIQREASGPGESATGATYLSLRLHPKVGPSPP